MFMALPSTPNLTGGLIAMIVVRESD